MAGKIERFPLLSMTTTKYARSDSCSLGDIRMSAFDEGDLTSVKMVVRLNRMNAEILNLFSLVTIS